MKKVAIGVRTLKGGTGASAIVLQTAKYFKEQGYNVDIYANKLNKELIRSYGLNPIKITLFGFSDYGKRLSFATKFDKIVKKMHYDLVIGHGDILHQDILFLHNVVFLANQLIVDENSKKIDTVGRFHNKIFSEGSFKHIVANSNLMKNELIHRYKIDENKIIVVYPGSDLSKFNIDAKIQERDNIRKKYNIGKNTIVVGLITSGNFRKRGVKLFLKACNLLDKDKKDIKFLLVGKEKHIDDYLNILNKDTKEKLLYFPSYKNIEELFYMLDFFVLPAFIEEFGLVVNEAIACGVVPIIGPNVGAGEKISNFREYMILEDTNENEIVQKIEYLLENQELVEKIIRSNFEVIKNSDWIEYNRKIEQLIS
ncbi:glycosyltransferase [hydrothermal vent metagenome]|uniref:Glycosyltransferase n=1 Tax=hydrothermal vent metagenome TaxID=652676 RepID=A0A1W1CX75_9ZZZZ